MKRDFFGEKAKPPIYFHMSLRNVQRALAGEPILLKPRAMMKYIMAQHRKMMVLKSRMNRARRALTQRG